MYVFFFIRGLEISIKYFGSHGSVSNIATDTIIVKSGFWHSTQIPEFACGYVDHGKMRRSWEIVRKKPVVGVGSGLFAKINALEYIGRRSSRDVFKSSEVGIERTKCLSSPG